MSATDHVSIPPGRPQRRPLLTTSIVIYVTLFLLAITIPRSLVNRVKDVEPNPVQAFLLRTAEAVAAMSHAVGLDRPFAYGRELFLKATGKQED